MKCAARFTATIALALAGVAGADDVEDRLDAGGDRIERRLDHRGDRVERRLDARVPLAWGSLALGIAVALFHAAAFSYFWLTLGIGDLLLLAGPETSTEKKQKRN